MYHLREQNRQNAQLVPTYRDQPANGHRRMLAVVIISIQSFV